MLAAGASNPPSHFQRWPHGTQRFEYDLQLAHLDGSSHNPASDGKRHSHTDDQKTCNKLVQKKFPLTQCFVFQNADGKGDSRSVLFELTCPGFDGPPAGMRRH